MYEDDDRSKPAHAAGTDASEGYRVYIGNLDFHADERAVESAFSKFGKLLKAEVIRDPDGRSKGFGFVNYGDEACMLDAIDQMNGIEFEGRQIKVSKALPRGERRDFDRGYSSRGYSDRDGDRDFDSRGERSYRGRDDDRGSGYSSRSEGYRSSGPKPAGYRVSIEGLYPECSWRELKDFLRKAGEVTYADVKSPGYGIGEYTSDSARRKAIAELDGNNWEGSRITMKTMEYTPRESNYGGDDGYGKGSSDRYNSSGGGYGSGGGGGSRYSDRSYAGGSTRDSYAGGYSSGGGGSRSGHRDSGDYDKGYSSQGGGYGGGYRSGGGYGGGGGYSEGGYGGRSSGGHDGYAGGGSRGGYDRDGGASRGGSGYSGGGSRGGADREYSGSRGGGTYGQDRSKPY